jgi:hypothetical protein
MALSRKPPPRPRNLRGPRAPAGRAPNEQDLLGNQGMLDRMRGAPAGAPGPAAPSPDSVWDEMKAAQEKDRHTTGTDLDTGNAHVDALAPNVILVRTGASEVPVPVPDLEAIERAGHANQDAWDGTRDEREGAAAGAQDGAEEARRRAEEEAEEARRRAEEERRRAEEAAAQAASQGQGAVSGAVDTVKGWF